MITLEQYVTKALKQMYKKAKIAHKKAKEHNSNHKGEYEIKGVAEHSFNFKGMNIIFSLDIDRNYCMEGRIESENLNIHIYKTTTPIVSYDNLVTYFCEYNNSDIKEILDFIRKIRRQHEEAKNK